MSTRPNGGSFPIPNPKHVVARFRVERAMPQRLSKEKFIRVLATSQVSDPIAGCSSDDRIWWALVGLLEVTVSKSNLRHLASESHARDKFVACGSKREEVLPASTKGKQEAKLCANLVESGDVTQGVGTHPTVTDNLLKDRP
jgi:hypothetical protein